MQHRHRNPQPFLTETPAHSTTTTLPKPDQPPAAASPQAECHTPLPLTEPLPQHQERPTSESSPGTDQPTPRLQQTTRSGRLIRKPEKFEDFSLY